MSNIPASFWARAWPAAMTASSDPPGTTVTPSRSPITQSPGDTSTPPTIEGRPTLPGELLVAPLSAIPAEKTGNPCASNASDITDTPVYDKTAKTPRLGSGGQHLAPIPPVVHVPDVGYEDRPLGGARHCDMDCQIVPWRTRHRDRRRCHSSTGPGRFHPWVHCPATRLAERCRAQLEKRPSDFLVDRHDGSLSPPPSHFVKRKYAALVPDRPMFIVTEVAPYLHGPAGVHGVLPQAAVALAELGSMADLEPVIVTDVTSIPTERLESGAVLGLFTIGETPWSEYQRQAIEAGVRSGRTDVLAVHSATDSCLGMGPLRQDRRSRFDGHPWTTEFSVEVTDADHPATRVLPEDWS